MPTDHEDGLRALWQRQLTGTQAPTPEQLRARAEQAASKARRNVRLNQLSAGLVATIIALSFFMQEGGLLFNVGKAMLLLVAVYVAWGMSYFFAPLPIPASAPAETCAAVHKRQLERQRDLYLSIRSGVRLNLPGVILVLVGSFWPADGALSGAEAWAVPLALVAIALFLSEVGITYGQIVARQLQREIDELDSMMKGAPR